MNVSIYLQKDYENKWQRRVRKNKPNSNPIKPNCRKGKIDAKCVFTKDYERNDIFTVRINKPNSKPIFEKPKMNINLYVIEDYENETAFRLKKTNPKQTQFQTTLIGTSKAHRYLANGRVSGTTFIWVVNL